MATCVDLAYGSENIRFEVPDAEILRAREPEGRVDPERFRQALDAFLSRSRPRFRRPAVVVADKTRLCGYPLYLPVLLQALVDHGADPGSLDICIAYGTHPPQSADESRKAYGAAFERWRWIAHDCENARFVDLGRTARGTPVRLRADLLEADGLVTFGAICHHYFAGFGGGRKLVFPGLGHKAAIYANHGLFLDRRARTPSSGCQPGVLTGNPLAEDLEEVERHRPADLAVHGLLDSTGQVRDLRVGAGADHFHRACARHADCYEIPARTRYDLVLASCGGFPKDINFIQSHKAIHNAAAFVRDGGHLIVLAQCRDGIGSQTFLPWFGPGGWDAAFDRLSTAYVGNGGTALAMMAKLARIRISLVTDLDGEAAARIGFDKLTANEAVGLVRAHRGAAAVIPNASLLIRKPEAA